MDRANQRFLVASGLTAIPLALLMVSLTTGTPPQDAPGPASDQTVAPAVLHQSEIDPETGEIQQVVGKQISSPKTRPGLLQVIAGSRSPGDRDHRHRNMRSDESRGLFDGLFGSDTRSKQRSTESGHKSEHKHHRQRHSSSHRSKHTHPNHQRSKDNVSWDGIPYHRPERSTGRRTRAPIHDPARKTSARSTNTAQRRTPTSKADTGTTRIIRGGSSRSVNANVASSKSNEPTLAHGPDEAVQVPKPPADMTPAPSVSKRISSTSSSRRTGRRKLSALEAQVARRDRGQSKADTEPKPKTDVALVPRAVADQSDSEPESETSSMPAAAPPSNVETPGTALAEIGAPTAQPPADATDVEATDEDDVTSPAATMPSIPYAASTPPGATNASAASHRAGPPSEAFEMKPIGSGVADDQTTSAEDARTDEPAYQTATLDGSPSELNSEPSATPGRMTTNGIPVGGNRVAGDNDIDPAPPAHAKSSGNVPIYPIADRQPASPEPFRSSTVVGRDNFDRAAAPRNQPLDHTNQMRAGATSHVTSDAMATASELPGIRVVTHGPREIMIRQTSQYEIRVENRGSIDAEGVLVRALVPDWAELGGQNATVGDVDVRQQGTARQLVWTISQLPAGTSERMFVRLTAARSGNYDLDVDWTLLPQKSVAKVQVHEPQLDLRIEGPDEVVFGQSQTYKVHVLNPGDGTAPGVVFTLSPNSATPQTQRIGDIPPGKEAQFDVELTANDLGDLKIHGLATGDLDLRAEAAKTIRVAAAKLEAMLSGPEVKFQNTSATYNLQVQNTGTISSEKIMAKLRLPAGVKFVGGLDEAVQQGDVLSWEIISLPPGGVRNYQFTCQMTTTGEHRFSFECRGTAAGQTAVSIATEVESIADLVLTVNDPPAPAPIGSQVVYEVIIRNRGSKEATDVRAVAQFSHGIEPQRIEGQSGEVVTGQVLFDPIGRIGPGQEVRLRVIAQAQRGGHHRFRSEVRSGDTVLVAEEATHYMSRSSERVSRHSSEAEPR